MPDHSVIDLFVALSGEAKAVFGVTDVNGNRCGKNKWLIHPSPGYLEFEKAGPLRIDDIQWVDIDPVIIEKTGRLMDEKRIDHSEDIIHRLKKAGISYSVIEGKIRVGFR